MPFTHLEATRFELQTEAQRRNLLVLHRSSLQKLCLTSEDPLFVPIGVSTSILYAPYENAEHLIDYAKQSRKCSAKSHRPLRGLWPIRLAFHCDNDEFLMRAERHENKKVASKKMRPFLSGRNELHYRGHGRRM